MDSPMSGYDIKKQVNAALGVATNASYGTLYPTLHKLLAEGAVEVQEIVQKGRPSKKVYQITNQGQQEFQTWLRQPAATDQVRREFLLKLYLAKNLTTHDLLKMVLARRKEAESLLKTLQRDEHEANTPQQQQWVRDYALSLCKAEIEWLKQVATQIAEHDGATEMVRQSL